METILNMATGAALLGGGYLLYVAATKGVPAAKAAFTTWWNKGKTELANIKADVADAHSKIAALEAKLATPAAAPAAAPAAPASA